MGVVNNLHTKVIIRVRVMGCCCGKNSKRASPSAKPPADQRSQTKRTESPECPPYSIGCASPNGVSPNSKPSAPQRSQTKTESVKSLPPPSYSDGDEDVSQKLDKIAEHAPKLAGLVHDSMERVTKSLEDCRKAVAEDLGACSPTVAMRINELHTFLLDVVRKGRSYCKACKDLGELGSDDTLIKDIINDLENGNVEELRDFLEELDDCLKVCETRFERVEKAGEAAKSETRKVGREFEKKEGEYAERERGERIGAKVTGAVGGGVIAVGAATTFLFPPAGIAMILFGVGTSAAAYGVSTSAGFTQKQREIFNQAGQAVINLDNNLVKAMEIINDMRQEIEDLEESQHGGIQQLKRLLKQSARIKRIYRALDNLKRNMHSLFERSNKYISKFSTSV